MGSPIVINRLNPSSFVHTVHGGFLHDLSIFLVEREIVVGRGKNGVDYEFLDKKWFLDKFHSKAIPDVYVKKVETCTDSHGIKKVIEQKYVIEVETNASIESIAKKKEHFLERVTGHELIIIDLGHCPDPFDLNILSKFIKERVP